MGEQSTSLHRAGGIKVIHLEAGVIVIIKLKWIMRKAKV
jgi:hypothetical protein